MKIRNGFVSNSSSSSFVIATDKSLKGKITLTIDVDLSTYAHKKIETSDELLEYMKYNYCWEPGDENRYCENIYNKAKASIESGKSVYFGLFSDEGTEGIEQMLCYEGLEKFVGEDENIDVILSEEGY